MGIKIFASTAIALIAVLPQIWAFLITPPGYFFGGINILVNISDIQGVYLSAIHNFSEGGILYQNPFDWPIKPFFIYPLYLILGKLATFSHFSSLIVYHLATFFLTIATVLFIFKFLEIFFDDFRRKIIALGLAVFGGLFFVGLLEGIGIFSFFIPHFIVAQLALFASLYFLIKIISSKGPAVFLFLSLAVSTVILSLTHPWMVMPLIIYLLFLCIFFARQNELPRLNSRGILRRMPSASTYLNASPTDLHPWSSRFKYKLSRLVICLVILLLISFPLLYYFQANVHWSDFSLNPTWYQPLLLYGFVLIFAALGLLRSLKNTKIEYFLLAVWFILQFIFVYLPFPFARRFIEGFYLPVAIFATIAIDEIIEKLHLRKYQNIVFANAFIYLSLGVIAHYLMLFWWLPNSLVYRPLEEKDANLFLDKNSGADQRVFSLPITSNFISSQVNSKFFIGHVVQTANFESKLLIMNDYFRGVLTLEEREKTLQEEEICYVYIGQEERQFSRLDFSGETYLLPYFDNGKVTIYKTKWC